MENQLTWDEYRVLARRTQDPSLSPQEKLAHAVLGLCSELHEAELEAAALVFGFPEFSSDVKQRLALEIGDCYWMIAEICDYFDGENSSIKFFPPPEPRNSRSSLPYVGNAAVEGARAHLCNLAQKAFQGHAPKKDPCVQRALLNIGRHLGQLAERSGFKTQTILHMNIEKLKERYPDGFSAERSVNREEDV